MPDEYGLRAEVLRVVLGGRYDYHEPRRTDQGVVRMCLGTYRVLGVARHVHTLQDLVVYEGLTGRDRGRMYVCTFSDFAAKFAPHEGEGDPHDGAGAG